MRWICKFCTYSTSNRRRILEHYKDSHGHYGRRIALPCIYTDCTCYFQSHKSLQRHVRQHASWSSQPVTSRILCSLCDFDEPADTKVYFRHLATHLKRKETVYCPFKCCSFKTSTSSSFTAHKSRYHNSSCFQDFKNELLVGSNSEGEVLSTNTLPESEEPGQSDDDEDAAIEQTADLREKIEKKLCSLLLRVQTLLHVSQSATQEIVDGFHEIGVLAGELSKTTVAELIKDHNLNIEEATLNLVTETLQKTNPLSCLSGCGPLGTEYRRQLTYRSSFQVVEPVEYVLDDLHKRTFVYVPISVLLPKLLNRADVIDKILEQAEASQSGEYTSFRDGLYYTQNPLFAGGESLTLSIGLYVDELELCNPLGTSRKKHKITAIYWVLEDLPVRYRSVLSSIYLAVLSNSNDVKRFGFEPVVEPLLQDLCTLETQGFYIDKLGSFIKGTVSYVSSDNLGAHSLAGFQESFNVGKFCRFCFASHDSIQTVSVRDGLFPLRTKLLHTETLNKVKESETSVDGVKSDCVLNKLTYFHCITGFPPDFLHDLLEGIVPVELCLCLKSLIDKRYFTLEELNASIRRFPYQFSDKTNRPQPIPKTFKSRKTIGGNGHENWLLLRLLPLIIGSKVPEHDETWEIVLAIKDIVEILASATFTEEKLCYLESRIFEHRQLLQEVFPDFKLKPKHHFLEHYPQLTRCFGPLFNLCTFRFEAKHSFFKKTVKDVNNFKNVLLTLASRHQLTLAYRMHMPDLFKPAVEVGRISTVSLDILDPFVKDTISRKFSNVTAVALTKTASLHGTQYTQGMFLSYGSTGGLPNFGKIIHILVVAKNPLFVVEPHTSWYVEHFRCFEVCKNPSAKVLVVQPEELNDYFPLSAYMVQEKLLVSPKAFLLD